VEDASTLSDDVGVGGFDFGLQLAVMPDTRRLGSAPDQPRLVRCAHSGNDADESEGDEGAVVEDLAAMGSSGREKSTLSSLSRPLSPHE